MIPYDALFIEAFLSRLLPIFNEVTLSAWMAFGHAVTTKIHVLSLLGAFAGYAVLYGIGFVMALHPWVFSQIAHHRVKARKIIMGLLCVAPFTVFIMPIVAGAGLYRITLIKTTGALIIAELLLHLTYS